MSDLKFILLELKIPEPIVDDLIKYFNDISMDLYTENYEKPSVGKFIETLVQMFQALDPKRSGYDNSVNNVDKEMSQIYEQNEVVGIPKDSRLMIVRMSRILYTLRNKRNIAHKNGIEPNKIDLGFIYTGAQWIMAELVRVSVKTNMNDAFKVIESIEKPIFPYIESISGKNIVLLESITTDEELILVLYNKSNVKFVSRSDIGKSLDRRPPSSVTQSIKKLWKDKNIEGDSKSGYCLTGKGVLKALAILSEKSITK